MNVYNDQVEILKQTLIQLIYIIEQWLTYFTMKSLPVSNLFFFVHIFFIRSVLKCKWHENVLSERPLKVRKITVYRFLISFLVPELSTFKDLKTTEKMVRKMRGLE